MTKKIDFSTEDFDMAAIDLASTVQPMMEPRGLVFAPYIPAGWPFPEATQVFSMPKTNAQALQNSMDALSMLEAERMDNFLNSMIDECLELREDLLQLDLDGMTLNEMDDFLNDMLANEMISNYYVEQFGQLAEVLIWDKNSDSAYVDMRLIVNFTEEDDEEIFCTETNMIDDIVDFAPRLTHFELCEHLNFLQMSGEIHSFDTGNVSAHVDPFEPITYTCELYIQEASWMKAEVVTVSLKGLQ